MRTLGLIGGTSWHATEAYYRLINEAVSNAKNELENPPLLIHSINIALMRTGDIDAINKKYLEVASSLELQGAEGIVICANTPHMVYDFVQPKISIPILHIADATAREAVNNGYKTLGLLGTKPTMTKPFLKNWLTENYNLTIQIPSDDKDLLKVHDFIANELTKGIFSEEAKTFYSQQIKNMHENGADAIILGCTELPLLLHQKDFEIPLLSTTELHAKMAVDFILN
ncbi:aspartate/glutamate racemase family protein [Aegicerativicinus sediminis]|uniref:aspartate/glutamate racemase family protein n=1 Tax=Aegicerativicinus sediminis TaxID=2893202 RepID=UPI001E484AB7|nr:amino acid racemase [Aegicerativicinus sediminis]